jgi:5'-nucleotidase
VRRSLVLLGLIAAALVAGSPPAVAAPTTVPVQILAINDLHGRISLTQGNESRLVTGPGPDGVYGKDSSGVSDDEVTRVGGAANLATTVEKLQSDFHRVAGGSAASFLVSGGDIIGASPPVSGDYRDEPSIEIANALGVDVSTVGDDEFSRGTQELLRISGETDGQNSDDVTACQGVTAGSDGCFGTGEHAFVGADYPYLAANVVSRRTGEPILPPYQILYTSTGYRVAMIGVVTPKTPEKVPAEGLGDVEIRDEADTVNRYVRELRAQGVQAIGVLMHDGGDTTGPAALDPNGCDGLAGGVLDLNQRIDPAVDLLVNGFTHGAYRCRLPVPGGEPRLVTQAGSYGRLVTDIRLTIDRASGDVDRAATYTATNVPVTRDAPDQRIAAIVDYWTAGPSNQPAPGEPADATAPVDAAASETPSRAWLGALALVGVVVVVVGTGVVLRRRTLERQFGVPARRRNPLRERRPGRHAGESPADDPANNVRR